MPLLSGERPPLRRPDARCRRNGMVYLMQKRGFTLIEILIVLGLIAILAGIVLIAINPARQFAQARNAQREAHLETILNAIGQNIADNKGIFTCNTGTPIPVWPATSTAIGTGAGRVNLSCLVPTYLATALPADPIGGMASDTLYTIQATSSRYIVCAPNHAEQALSGSTEYCLTR